MSAAGQANTAWDDVAAAGGEVGQPPGPLDRRVGDGHDADPAHAQQGLHVAGGDRARADHADGHAGHDRFLW